MIGVDAMILVNPFFILIVYWYLRTFNIMAIDFKFVCSVLKTDYLSVSSSDEVKKVFITGISYGEEIVYSFDLKTAIKFAKTLRTEINKIKE
jgi:hypothetical protein